jgi:hypothetical protein
MDGELNKCESIYGIYLRFEILTAVAVKLTEDFHLLGYNAV